MTDDRLQGAIDVLLEQLASQQREVGDTKRMINNLCRRMGQEPMFSDTEEEALGSPTIKADQYYGQPLSTAVADFLVNVKRKSPATAEEIVRALEQGGYLFPKEWKQDRARILSISLAKNTKTFHRLPSGAYGLLSWYPEIPKEKRSAVNKEEKKEETTSPRSAATEGGS